MKPAVTRLLPAVALVSLAVPSWAEVAKPAPQLQAPADVTLKTVNMAMELEGLSFALTNRD